VEVNQPIFLSIFINPNSDLVFLSCLINVFLLKLVFFFTIIPHYLSQANGVGLIASIDFYQGISFLHLSLNISIQCIFYQFSLFSIKQFKLFIPS